METVNFAKKEPEIKSLDRTADKLIDLDLNEVLDSLLAKGLINRDSHSELDHMLQNGKRAPAVRKVIEEIRLNPPGFLETFIKILKDNGRTAYLGEFVAEGQL